MNRFNSRNAIANLKKVCFYSLIAAAVSLIWWLSVPVDAGDDEQSAGKPIIVLLTPHDGAMLNATTLQIQALAAAVKSDPRKSFSFNGQAVPGKNAGQVNRVELALDGILNRSLDTRNYGRQLLAEFTIDLSPLANGLHIITVTAYQGERNASASQTVSFTIDRSLVPAAINRIEAAATPKAFGGFSLSAGDGNDDNEQGDRDWQSPARLNLKGSFVANSESDGIDLSKDRLVVAVGSRVAVIEPSMLRCDTREKTCRFEDSSRPFIQFFELKKKDDRQWTFRLRGNGPMPPDARAAYLRIGNDWGGIDLRTGERLVGLRPDLDTSHQGQALIGVNGGTVETVEAAGVIIRLEIPPNALTQDTIIKVTPLQASPLAGSATSLHPGVKFEPEGLQFAEAATLTMDFSATNQIITDNDSIFLLTSPLTALPLYGTTDPTSRKLTARLHHFSAAQPGAGSDAYMDLSAWASSVLLGTNNLSIRELELLAAMILAEQRRGCRQNCLDSRLFLDRASASIAALVSEICPSSVANPTDQALERLLQLETMGQGLGVDTVALGTHTCAEQIFRALIDIHGTNASINPSETNLARLLNDVSKAQQFGFDGLDTIALQKLASALRALAAQAQAQACAGNTTVATNMLNLALAWASAVASVDASLAGELQTALGNIQAGRSSCGAMSVVLNPNDAAIPGGFGTNITLLYTGQCSFRVVAPDGIHEITGEYDRGCRYSPGPRRFGAPAPPPLVLDGAIPNVQAHVSVTQPSANVLAVDATASVVSPNGWENNWVQLNVIADLTFTKAGVLDLSLNPEWAETGSEEPDRRDLVGISAFNVDYGRFVNFGSIHIVNGGVIRPTTGGITIAGPSTLRLYLQLTVGQDAYVVNHTTRAAGRAITVTFTPTPQR